MYDLVPGDTLFVFIRTNSPRATLSGNVWSPENKALPWQIVVKDMIQCVLLRILDSAAQSAYVVYRTVKLWCAIHIHPAHPDLIICEFELDDDHEFPLRPDDERTPDIPEDTLRGNPTMEELAESTEITSKPLRVLRSARKRRGEAGAMQVFDIMSQVQEQLASAPNLERFLKILVGIVKELTGFHRVMVYQFDASFNGKVVTELVDPIRQLRTPLSCACQGPLLRSGPSMNLWLTDILHRDVRPIHTLEFFAIRQMTPQGTNRPTASEGHVLLLRCANEAVV